MKVIKKLIERTSSRNTLSYIDIFGNTIEEKFKWNEPASEMEIQEFELKNNIKLPESYREFLKVSNGSIVYDDVKYGGGGYRILGLDEILKSTTERIEWGYEIKDYWIVFAEVIGNSDILLFDLKKSDRKEKHYIVDGDANYLVDDWRYLKDDFYDFINRLILANGSQYWRWF